MWRCSEFRQGLAEPAFLLLAGMSAAITAGVVIRSPVLSARYRWIKDWGKSRPEVYFRAPSKDPVVKLKIGGTGGKNILQKKMAPK